MAYVHRDPEMLWTPLSVPGWQRAHLSAAQDRLLQMLLKWEGTPYESGQSCCGLGADCIGGVFGVVDDVDLQGRRLPAGMPADVAMHNRDTAVRAMREIIARYQPAQKVKPVNGIYQVQPSDIIVTGMTGGGPGHIGMVGPQQNTMWESVPSTGFRRQGWSFDATQTIWAVYRLMNKDQWLEAL